MKYLVVIDMQYDFVSGSLGTPEAAAILDNVKNKIKAYLEDSQGCRILYTKDTHTEDYLHTQEGHHLPVAHCIKGTNGWEIVKELLIPGAEIIEKPAFGSLELAERIAAAGDAESIELVGVCTDICVISNALILKARLPEVPISVDARCCAGVTPESHEKALATMRMCQIDIPA